jgi:hypothetical protein
MIGSFPTACRFHGKIQIKSDEIAVLTWFMAANFSLIGCEWITALPLHSNEVSSSVRNKGSFFPHLIASQPGFHECGI